MVLQQWNKQKKINKVSSRYKWNSKRGKKSEEQKGAIKNIKILYESREKVIKLFNSYSKIVSEAKYKAIYGDGNPMDLAVQLRILTPKQMLQ